MAAPAALAKPATLAAQTPATPWSMTSSCRAHGKTNRSVMPGFSASPREDGGGGVSRGCGRGCIHSPQDVLTPWHGASSRREPAAPTRRAAGSRLTAPLRVR